MGYIKTIAYKNYLELYQYEKDIKYNGRKSSSFQRTLGLQGMGALGDDPKRKKEQGQEKRKDNARRSAMAFKRLVLSNLGEFDHPLFISFTYAENQEDVGQGYKDFKAFVRVLRSQFGEAEIRYIVVPEFQKRGAVHFHALFWGLQAGSLEKTERYTRLVARLWGKGFVDIILTDGSEKLAGYMAKYMTKSFLDGRLSGQKSYMASRNVLRPVVDKNPVVSALFFGGLIGVPNLSTSKVLHEKDFMTEWLGKGRFRLYQL